MTDTELNNIKRALELQEMINRQSLLQRRQRYNKKLAMKKFLEYRSGNNG